MAAVVQHPLFFILRKNNCSRRIAPVPRSEAGKSLRVVRSPARMEEWVDSDFSVCFAGAVASIVPPKPGTRIVWKVG